MTSTYLLDGSSAQISNILGQHLSLEAALHRVSAQWVLTADEVIRFVYLLRWGYDFSSLDLTTQTISLMLWRRLAASAPVFQSFTFTVDGRELVYLIKVVRYAADVVEFSTFDVNTQALIQGLTTDFTS